MPVLKPTKPGRPPVHFIESRKEALRYLDEAAKQEVVSLDTEFDLSKERRDVIVVFSYSWGRGVRRVVRGELIQDVFADWMVDPKIKKVYQTFTADAEKFEALGLDMEPSFYADIEVMDWLRDENALRHGLKEQSLRLLKWKRYHYTDLFKYVPLGKSKPVVLPPSVVLSKELPAEAVAAGLKPEELWFKFLNYSGDDAESTFMLFLDHKRHLQRVGYWQSYLKIDGPYTITLKRMGDRGMPIDMPSIHKGLRQVLVDRLRAVTAFRRIVKRPDLNMNSHHQLKPLLFDERGWPTREDMMTDGGAPKLDKYALEWLVDELDGEDRALAKLKQEYNKTDTNRKFFAGIRNGISEDGRIRSDFKQTAADTGRVGSRKWEEQVEIAWTTKKGEERTKVKKIKLGMNLQNIPRKKEVDRYGMRKMFIAEPKYRLVCADYGGFELLMAIHFASQYTDDSKMLELMQKYKSPSMIHAMTAQRFKNLKCDLKDVKKLHPDAYDLGKQCNFTLIYRGFARTVCQRLGWDKRDERKVQKVQRYIDIWNETYPEMSIMQTGQVAHGYEHGFVTDIAGGLIHVGEGLQSEDEQTRWYWERKCINSPCQRSAAVIVKCAMNLIENDEEMQEYAGRKGGQIGQVHDEIVFMSREKYSAKAKDRMVHLMKQPFKDKLKFELVVDAHEGASWDEAKG